MVDLENRLRYFVRNIVAVDKWPFRFGYSYRGGGSVVLKGKSPRREMFPVIVFLRIFRQLLGIVRTLEWR